MAYYGLSGFIKYLEKNNELQRIKTFFNPLLEIAEMTDRVSKTGGKALLFENNGTDFPLLINTFGSEKRMVAALSRINLEDTGNDFEKTISIFYGASGGFMQKLSGLTDIIKLSGILPVRSTGKGKCQKVIHKDPDLNILPVLKCWPYDGGRFITLPMVHTIHPETAKTNVGMYRMQILGKKTTGMHWQRHKTGANHFEAWKKTGDIMPVSVALGGDPVYTYSATAPLPENIDEYILAGFLRRKKVKLVKCLTNDLYVPEDSDIIIEGYVNPAEELVWEGPFGDHTGFYSLADWYPRFHVTCITHSPNAVYPATIVGIPPQEDSFLTKATEKIFLAPIKLTLQPEIEDIHLPDPGVAHNLVIVKIKKSYPGQGLKVISSLFGTGQMMFTKYLVVVSGQVDIRNYIDLSKVVFSNTDFSKDLLFSRGPLDVLDHSSDTFSFGGKLGIDATEKTREETINQNKRTFNKGAFSDHRLNNLVKEKLLTGFNHDLLAEKIPVLIMSVNRTENNDIINKVKNVLNSGYFVDRFHVILIVDHTVDVNDYFIVAWQVLANSDPLRDHDFVSGSSLLIDGTIKAYRPGGFIRKWPDIVCSDMETINTVDQKCNFTGTGTFIPSPSLKAGRLKRSGNEEIIVK